MNIFLFLKSWLSCIGELMWVHEYWSSVLCLMRGDKFAFKQTFIYNIIFLYFDKLMLCQWWNLLIKTFTSAVFKYTWLTRDYSYLSVGMYENAILQNNVGFFFFMAKCSLLNCNANWKWYSAKTQVQYLHICNIQRAGSQMIRNSSMMMRDIEYSPKAP